MIDLACSSKLTRRRFLHLSAGAAVLPALPRIARAQTYPSRLIVSRYWPRGSLWPISRFRPQ